MKFVGSEDNHLPAGSAVPYSILQNYATAHHEGGSNTITVSDPYLLFAGEYNRVGLDLVLTKDDRKLVLEGYFQGEKRSALSSLDGSSLSGDVVNALTGHVQYAQASGAADLAKVIGHVTKLIGSATAIRNGVSIILNSGDNVQKGDVVQAGSDSSLGITFIDGTVFGLSSNARMMLNEMVYDPNGSLNSSLLTLIAGTITFVAGETAKHGDMKVDTPTAVLGIRGTAVLVEIGFEVTVTDPGGTSRPAPVKFQVLQEPNGTIGSYVLYAKSDVNFSNPIATVNRAGEVVSYSANGQLSFAQVTQLAPEAKAIIEQTLQTYFPNYTPPSADKPAADKPGTNPQSTGPTGGGSSTPPPAQTTPQQDKVPVEPNGPTKSPINYNAPAAPDALDAQPVIKQTEVIFALNTAPSIVVAPVFDKATFKIGDQVTITDPDTVNPAFNDVAEPYVAGSAIISSVIGPAPPSGANLKSRVTVDQTTGTVEYDRANFAYLKPGDKVVVSIEFDSRSGPDTVRETLSVTISGFNDAPVLSPVGPSLAPLQINAATNAGQTVASLVGNSISDPDVDALRGVAITASTQAYGKWQFSTDDGVTWADFGSYSASSALLLADTDTMRFVPDGVHQETATFSYVAWDQTAGTHGTTDDTTAAGSVTAFSSSSDTAAVVVFSPTNV
ncbi:FecR family protein, partial [Bradyrhizobium sp. CCBAU 11361]|uniref:FecR family protein n=1 Tax=Bradyrhizobium sp. CCBAU 11361 TaxID=1630812 RepID=UPI002304C8D6